MGCPPVFGCLKGVQFQLPTQFLDSVTPPCNLVGSCDIFFAVYKTQELVFPFTEWKNNAHIWIELRIPNWVWIPLSHFQYLLEVGRPWFEALSVIYFFPLVTTWIYILWSSRSIPFFFCCIFAPYIQDSQLPMHKILFVSD